MPTYLRHLPRLLPSLALLLAASLPAAATTRTLSGRYVWEGGADGTVKATFTETAPHEWSVAFDFRFDGVFHTYAGTASGSLDDGELRGRVTTENRRRVFSFTGRVEGGTFSGTHAEIVGRSEERTGTLVLAP